jgi:hypothetical protein
VREADAGRYHWSGQAHPAVTPVHEGHESEQQTYQADQQADDT